MGERKMAKKKTILQQFAAVNAAAWFDIARNGGKVSALTIHFRDRRFAMELGRKVIEGELVTESQAKYGLDLLEKFRDAARRNLEHHGMETARSAR
jgi:hypothetical protein